MCDTERSQYAERDVPRAALLLDTFPPKCPRFRSSCATLFVDASGGEWDVVDDRTGGQEKTYAVPPEYAGREQSYLKHRVLKEYLDRWSHKIGSRATKIWFVDCFSGPWKSRDQDLKDTSIHIGLQALAGAVGTWTAASRALQAGAIFVEKHDQAFAELQDYITRHHRESQVDIQPIHGEFGASIPRIQKLVGTDPAFIFVDPTGFKGAAMSFLQPLTRPRVRDVLVNVMFDFANRFSAELSAHLQAFFGVDKAALEGLEEEDLLDLYRSSLKKHCGLQFAADLRVPHPLQERTWFRLVVGGRDKAVLEVFRDVEQRVMGREAGHARDAARRAAEAARSGTEQLGLFASSSGNVPMPDDGYAARHAEDERLVADTLLSLVRVGGPQPWRAIWPRLLEEHHVTLTELGHVGARLREQGLISVTPWARARRTLHNDDVVGPVLDPA